MLRKAKLVKKETIEKTSIVKEEPITETRNRIQLRQQIVQTTKDWLVSHRQQQTNARQAFASLFMNSDTHSNAI